jgi:hypothetical protein
VVIESECHCGRTGNREKGILLCVGYIVRDIGVVMSFSAWHSEAVLLPEFTYRLLSDKIIFG